MKNKLLVITLISIFLISFVFADMPENHIWMQKEAFRMAPNSPVGLTIANNFQDYEVCQLLVDSSLFYYFSGPNTIGKEYISTHSTQLAIYCLSIATTDSQKACCYGIGSHHVSDSFSHNYFVPKVLERTNLPNGIGHVLAEEKEKDILAKTHPELTQEVRSALINRVPAQKEFLIKVLSSQKDLGDVDVGKLIDAYTSELVGNDKFVTGFRAFTVIPLSIHLMLILIFFSSLMILALLIRMKRRNIFNWIGIGITLFLVLSIILLYILYFTGTLWRFFEFASTPLSALMPTGGLENLDSQELNSMIQYMNNGVTYLNSIPDPSGQVALANASSKGALFRNIIIFILFVLIALFVWLNFRKKK